MAGGGSDPVLAASISDWSPTKLPASLDWKSSGSLIPSGLALALTLSASLAAADVSRPGGAGHALLFRDHGVVIENFKDLGKAAPLRLLELNALQGEHVKSSMLRKNAAVGSGGRETSRQLLLTALLITPATARCLPRSP